MIDPSTLQFGPDGLLPAVVQTPAGDLRMLAWMNAEALETTLRTGLVTFWSRSRNRLWTKGEESGHTLKLVSVAADCDRDALLLVAEPAGPTCHRGTDSCFDGDAELAPVPWLERLEALLRHRKATASNEGSYTQKLFARGAERIAKKVVEEAGEVALAAQKHETARTPQNRQDVVEEAADLLFHLQTLLVSQGLTLADAAAVLQHRHAARIPPASSPQPPA
jgi:phosphoribosyl-ATP pyrophosphohydrolase/phosphoribosyl-AMP cyclohydrolase